MAQRVICLFLFLRNLDLRMLLMKFKSKKTFNSAIIVRIATAMILFALLFSAMQIDMHSSHVYAELVQTGDIQYVTSYLDYPGIVLYFPLIEGKGNIVFDTSGYNNHGVCFPTENVEWVPSGGVRFDGVSTSIRVNASASLQNSSKTVLIRFKWDGNVTDSEMYLYDDGWPNASSLIMYLHPETSRFYVEFITHSGNQKNLWHPIIANTTYTAIFSFNDFGYDFWLNDQKKSGSFSNSETLQTTSALTLGSDYENSRRRFSGYIYSVQIFNQYLTSEISRLLEGQNQLRVDPNSRYVICGLVSDMSGNNGLAITPIQVYLNKTIATYTDTFGTFRFAFNLPAQVGNYTYTVATSNSSDGLSTSVVVDQVKICDSGATSAAVGEEAFAWFELVSDFDGQPVVSGTVSLTGGLNATWNSDASHWEYRETRNDVGNITLRVESVFWDKYGLTFLSSSDSNVVTMEWVNPPWYTALLPWFSGIGPALFGIIGLLGILAILLRLGVIKISTEDLELSEPTDQLRTEIANLIKSSRLDNSEALFLSQTLNKLLHEEPPHEVLEFLRNSLPALVKELENNRLNEE